MSKVEEKKLPPGVHVWEFALDDSATRHRVELNHNTLTGKRVLKLDGKQIHKVSAKYKLTGTIKFQINEHVIAVCIEANGMGDLNYALMLDDKNIPDITHSQSNAQKCSKWDVKSADGERHLIAFDKDTFEVYIDNVAVEAAADFVDVGSAYLFDLPGGEAGKITVKPTKRTDKPVVELFVNDRLVGTDDSGSKK